MLTMSVQKELNELISRIPVANRWKVDQEIDFENKDIRGQIVQQHLGKIANCMIDWQLDVADELRLVEADKADILYQSNPGLQRRKALNVWKSRVGAQGTYRALMEVFVRANKRDYAKVIVNILSEGAEVTTGSDSSGAFPMEGVQASGGVPNQGAATIPHKAATEISTSSRIGTDGGTISFSPNMKSDRLNLWLLQECGEYHKESIDKLKQVGIDGELFLMLPEDNKLLESLELPYLFKVLIVKKAKEHMAHKTATAACSSDADLPRLPSRLEVPTAQFFECGTADLDVPTFSAGSASAESGELSAWVPENVTWPKGKKVLQVKFLNDIPTHWTYKKGGLNQGNIEQWANIWSDRGDGIVPRFEFVDGSAPSDIRIMFVDTDKENSRSKVGKKAEDQASDKPTMWLNLRSGGDDYKKHVVIHEFGHALGLGHEHQRSDFWKRLKSCNCIDIDAIKSEVGEASFKVNWGKDSDYKRKNATAYDPHSVMHYPFKKEWLKPDYSDTTKVEEALKEEYITSKVAAILHGVLERAKNPYTTEPSTEDINLLKQLYSQGSSKGSICTIQAPPSLDRVESDSQDTTSSTNQRAGNGLSHKSLYQQLKPYAAQWREIGTHLGFHQTDLNSIQAKPAFFMDAPGSWFSAMLEAWLEWKPGDSRGSVSLKSLKNAVDKAGLGKTATELHQ